VLLFTIILPFFYKEPSLYIPTSRRLQQHILTHKPHLLSSPFIFHHYTRRCEFGPELKKKFEEKLAKDGKKSSVFVNAK